MAVETFTFLFTDIEGSTVLLRRLRESLYTQVLADHRSLIRSGLATHGGREVDTQGDGLFAVFSSPSACWFARLDADHANLRRAARYASSIPCPPRGRPVR